MLKSLLGKGHRRILLDSALGECTEALKLEPNSPGILDTLA